MKQKKVCKSLASNEVQVIFKHKDICLKIDVCLKILKQLSIIIVITRLSNTLFFPSVESHPLPEGRLISN